MASGNNNRANMGNQHSRHKGTHPRKAMEQPDIEKKQEQEQEPAHEYYPEFDQTSYKPGKKIDEERE